MTLLRHSQPPTPLLRQRHIRIPLVALRTLGFSRLCTSILTILTKTLLRHSLPSMPPLRQRHIRIPLLALPNLGFFPASLRPF